MKRKIFFWMAILIVSLIVNYSIVQEKFKPDVLLRNVLKIALAQDEGSYIYYHECQLTECSQEINGFIYYGHLRHCFFTDNDLDMCYSSCTIQCDAGP
jgi:hypothetical protein